MNTNTNLSFLQSHSFPFFNRQTSNKDIHSDSIAGSSIKKSVFSSSVSRNDLKSKYLHKKQIQQTKQCCKRFFTFLFSHIGLSAVLVGYVIIGGFMFQNLEVNNEIKIKITVLNNRTKFIKLIIDDLRTIPGVLINIPGKNNTDIKIKNQTSPLEDYLHIMIINYTKHIIFFMQEKGWNGIDDNKNLNWSYEGALLYVITVITTIGYGHVAPKTGVGKFMTMLYALLGIPLTFLYLSNIGDYLADWFRFIYHKVCRKYCKLCCRKPIKHHSALRSRLRKTNAFPGLATKNTKQERKKKQFKTNNIFDRSIKTIRDKFVKFPNKDKEIDENISLNINQDTSESSSNSNSQNEPYVLKSYGIAKFLPSVKTIKQREFLMMNCISTHVPLINWRDIDKDLEIGSLDNIPNAIIDCAEINNESHLSFCDRNSNQIPFNNKTSDDLAELKISTSFTRNKNNQLYKSLPYLSSITDSSLRNSSNPFRNSSYTPDINFVTESIRQVSYVSVNNIIEIECEKKSNNNNNNNNNNNQQKTVKLQASTVPISLSLSVIWIYIIFGSVIFTMWEDNDYLKWSYFCFITLSTIGFGDIVPGTKVDSDNPKEKLILVSVYVIIGLSVFAMCFKLMQEEVVAKFKRLGRKFGNWKNKVKNHKYHEKNAELMSIKRGK